MKTMFGWRAGSVTELVAKAECAGPFLHRIATESLVVAAYVSLGVWLSCDTGFAPWQWQFWLMFGPLYTAGELAWRAWPVRSPFRLVLPAPPPD